MEEEKKAKNDTSVMAKLTAKIIDNLQIRIKHVHIRFEDHSSCPGHPFAAGVILEKLHVYSPTEDNETSTPLLPGMMRKKVRVTRLGVYWDFDESACIHAKSVETLQQEMNYAFADPKNVPADRLGVVPRHWIVEPISLSLRVKADTRKVELRKPEVGAAIASVVAELGWSEQIDETRRIIHAYKHVRKDGVRGRSAEEEWELMVAYMLAKHPGAFTEQSIAMARDFCERCWDRSNRASPMLEVEGEMDQVFVVVEQKQYRDLLQCVASLNTQSLRAKYKRFKPAEGVEESPRKWWQFAVKSVCWENARQRQNQGWKAFMEFKALRMEYIELYKRKNEKDAGVAARLAALEEKLSLENIVLFRKIAKEEMKVEGAKKEKEKKEKKKKGVWSRFFKKGSEEEEEEEPVWTEKTREELFSEFDIDESDVSPWEGGRPDDVQVTAQFKLNKLGVSLRNNGRAVLEMRFVQLATSVVKKKAFLQVFAALNDLSMEDESAEAGALRQVVYPEKNAVFDAAKLSVFVPSVLVTENETPFFQAALEIPSLDKSADVVVRVNTLPLCVVGNVACAMDVLGFVVPELSRLDLSVLTASASALYSDLSAPKRRKLRAAKEASSHKYVRYDIWLGAVHVVLPESNSASVDETRSIVVRLGDVAIRSDPKRVEAGTVLDATNIYDNVAVSVSSANVLLTNGEKEWMRREVQEEQNLYIVDDFNLEATIGLSIAPSEVAFARTRVSVESEMMCVRLTREKYLAVMRFTRAFGRSVREVVESSEVDFASLKSQAIQMASNAMAVDKSVSETVSETEAIPDLKETSTPSEEITSELNSPEDDLQQSHLLSVAVHIAGVSVLIEEVSAANEHMAIVKTAIAGLEVSVEQRTFDTDVAVSLNRIEVKDCLQSLSKREERFLVVSKTVNEKGEIDRDTEQDLFKVTVAVVKPCSPDYASASSDVSVHVCFGSLSGGRE